MIETETSPVVCGHCGEAFERSTGRGRPRTYCSVRCQRRHKSGMPYLKAWRASPKGVHAKRSTGLRKRFRRRGGNTDGLEIFHPDDIFVRDGWKCQICGVPIFLNTPGSPDRATVDHVIAVVDGGLHTMENCQAACHCCNSKKGVREQAARKAITA